MPVLRAPAVIDYLAMEFSPEKIFISYSRTDGRAFAEAFERRLEKEAKIKSWRDLKSVEGGEDIRPQVLRAIEKVKHLVLILSRRALESDWVKREWTHARLVGRKVSPVLADPTIKRSNLTGWIRRADVYDISEPERWRMLVLVLEGPGETRRVPYMSGDLPDDFVPRPSEYGRLKEAVVSAGRDATVGITTALRGAGGYGKTTLANALCRDPDIRFEFTDGILRVEIGKERNDLTGLVVDLIEKLDPNARRPGFQDVQTASEHLAELIGEARLLLVIDDVWREAQLRPFLRGGPNCVRLVTTRLPHVLPKTHNAIDIDEMRAQEALSLISANLPAAGTPAALVRLAGLARRLGYWAQMLSIANGWLRDRVSTGEPLGDAIDRFEQRLNKRGLTAFDPKDETQRNRAIRVYVEASLEDLDANELARLCELAIFPEEESVPLNVVAGLWAEAGGVDEDDADQLIGRFDKLSLLQGLDRRAHTVWLHDNMIWYLRDRIGAEGTARPMSQWFGHSGRAATAIGRSFRQRTLTAGSSRSGIFARLGRIRRLTSFSSITTGSRQSYERPARRTCSPAICQRARTKARNSLAGRSRSRFQRSPPTLVSFPVRCSAGSVHWTTRRQRRSSRRRRRTRAFGLRRGGQVLPHQERSGSARLGTKPLCWTPPFRSTLPE